MDSENLYDAISPWTYDPETYVLEYRGYEMNISACTDSAKVLDRIIQIADKTWADDAVIAGLVVAFERLLRPQSTLCSGGQHKTLTVDQLVQLLPRVS
ncbi:MAG: hypothetical protein BGO96_05360 [Micrococcales bacterium 73-15]|nr:MAG: hypothetical protein BGO96_05360 [Micrococcales bacterium 73-15]